MVRGLPGNLAPYTPSPRGGGACASGMIRRACRAWPISTAQAVAVVAAVTPAPRIVSFATRRTVCHGACCRVTEPAVLIKRPRLRGHPAAFEAISVGRFALSVFWLLPGRDAAGVPFPRCGEVAPMCIMGGRRVRTWRRH